MQELPLYLGDVSGVLSMSAPANTLSDARAYVRWLARMGLQVSSEELAARLSAPQAVTEPDEAPQEPCDLEGLRSRVSACEKCALSKTRTNVVFGTGSPTAKLMFIGEAPGETEDKTGQPFVGAAGKLLTQTLEKNGVKREEVFIANVLKCRPPGNRDPLPDEIAACEAFLHEQIRVIKPGLLCALGRYAAQQLLKREISIMKIRGTWDTYQGLPLLICLHPAAILYHQANRPLFEADLAALAKAYHELR